MALLFLLGVSPKTPRKLFRRPSTLLLCTAGTSVMMMMTTTVTVMMTNLLASQQASSAHSISVRQSIETAAYSLCTLSMTHQWHRTGCTVTTSCKIVSFGLGTGMRPGLDKLYICKILEAVCMQACCTIAANGNEYSNRLYKAAIAA